MAKTKTKYDVTQYIGVPVEQDATGRYVIKNAEEIQLHSWRTGKHTKGRYTKLGQVFLTENNLTVAVVATAPVAFKDRHDFTPLQRFTSEFIEENVLAVAHQQLGHS
ncbi:hypothetical protein GPK34_08845 [Secundilactobacillus kimchicus]|uniref:DUF7671 family protein n=1 Tax=Secundilactobacillus kimchicus TaxID=528209 RepID=UPI001C024D07|nr:hypothetical protein [Secundilactobacillus kimchicus]